MKILLLTAGILLSNLVLASSKWEVRADFGGEARHRTTSFGIGNKGYVGLGHYNGAGPNILFEDWWEYDPATNAWTQKADYQGGISYHAAGFSIGAYGYVGTGRISPLGNTLVQSFYRYSPVTNTWNQVASFPGSARRGAVAFVIDGFGYVGTGESNSGLTSDFYKYNPATDAWSPVASLPGLSRTSSVGLSVGNYGYVGTGQTTSGASKDFWRYDPVTNSWMQMPNIGNINRQEACGFAVDGKAYIGTGAIYSSGACYKDFYAFDPATNTWDSIEEFRGTARRYMASLVINEFAYVGLGTNGTNFLDFWKFEHLKVTGLEEMNLVISCYPNPAQEQIQIQSEYKDWQRFQVIDFTGRVHLAGNYTSSISVQSLAKGPYLLMLSNNETSVKTQFIKN